jgi:hypothetical protein
LSESALSFPAAALEAAAGGEVRLVQARNLGTGSAGVERGNSLADPTRIRLKRRSRLAGGMSGGVSHPVD